VVVTNMFGDRWSYFVLGGYFFVFWGVVDRGIRIATESSAAVQEQGAEFVRGDAPATVTPQEASETSFIGRRM